MQTIMYQWTISRCLFQNFNTLEFDFQCFRKKEKNKNLKENMQFTFQEELWLMRKENQIIKTQTNNPIQYFQRKQKQKQTNELLNANEKCPFEPTSIKETPKTQLSTNPWFSSSQIHSTPEVRENENANKS